MSSLRNAFKSQRTHRERHQPQSRHKFGLLEKKKDYKQRADDYNKKQTVLRKLREKALDKNPDEFYFHMINSKVIDGQHYDRRKDETLTEDEIKLMQSRDLKYIVQRRTMEKNKIRRLEANLHFLHNEEQQEGSSNKHVFFVDSKEEKKNFDLAKRLDTHPSLLSRVHNRPKMETLQKHRLPSLESSEKEVLSKRTQKAYKELEQRVNREKSLGVLQSKMEVRKAMRDKKQTPHKIVEEETKDRPAVIKWKFERKR